MQVYLCTTLCTWCLQRQKKKKNINNRYLETEVADSCELWLPGLNPGPLEAQPVILTVELCLQSLLGAYMSELELQVIYKIKNK